MDQNDSTIWRNGAICTREHAAKTREVRANQWPHAAHPMLVGKGEQRWDATDTPRRGGIDLTGRGSGAKLCGPMSRFPKSAYLAAPLALPVTTISAASIGITRASGLIIGSGAAAS